MRFLIKGAREHNLQNVDIRLPRNQLICLTGVSGSGKSSLAFDTLYAERSTPLRRKPEQFRAAISGPDAQAEVGSISVVSVQRSASVKKSSGQNPRSTVGTITEVYDYLRVLYARVGQGHCPSATARSRLKVASRSSSGSCNSPKGRDCSCSRQSFANRKVSTRIVRRSIEARF